MENRFPKGPKNPKVLHSFSLLPGNSCLLTGGTIMVFFFTCILYLILWRQHLSNSFLVALFKTSKQTQPISICLIGAHLQASWNNNFLVSPQLLHLRYLCISAWGKLINQMQKIINQYVYTHSLSFCYSCRQKSGHEPQAQTHFVQGAKQG